MTTRGGIEEKNSYMFTLNNNNNNNSNWIEYLEDIGCKEKG